jgi:hypothetical protein
MNWLQLQVQGTRGSVSAMGWAVVMADIQVEVLKGKKHAVGLKSHLILRVGNYL